MKRVAMVLSVWGVGWLLLNSDGMAQDRKTKVLDDKKAIEETGLWTYNNLDQGIEQAQKSGKPLLVVFRCIL